MKNVALIRKIVNWSIVIVPLVGLIFFVFRNFTYRTYDYSNYPDVVSRIWIRPEGKNRCEITFSLDEYQDGWQEHLDVSKIKLKDDTGSQIDIEIAHAHVSVMNNFEVEIDNLNFHKELFDRYPYLIVEYEIFGTKKQKRLKRNSELHWNDQIFSGHW